MRLVIDFSSDFLSKVQNRIDETWDGAPVEYTVPDLSIVVLNAFDTLAEWADDDASQKSNCQKIDSCGAEALVLQELSELFRGIRF